MRRQQPNFHFARYSKSTNHFNNPVCSVYVPRFELKLLWQILYMCTIIIYMHTRGSHGNVSEYNEHNYFEKKKRKYTQVFQTLNVKIFVMKYSCVSSLNFQPVIRMYQL